MFAGPFYFLRHGVSEANTRGIIAGSLDFELTAFGREQAQAAALALADEPITAIYSSPLRRARDTAELVACTLRLPVTILGEIAERRRGELEGQPEENWVAESLSQASETFPDFAERVLHGLVRVDTQVPLVVSHGGVFRVLCRALEIVHPELCANAAPLRFVPHDSGWKLEMAPFKPISPPPGQ
jgi:broad specificity phosphatase PhoE